MELRFVAHCSTAFVARPLALLKQVGFDPPYGWISL